MKNKLIVSFIVFYVLVVLFSNVMIGKYFLTHNQLVVVNYVALIFVGAGVTGVLVYFREK